MRVLLFLLFVFGARSTLRTDQQYWRDLAHRELEDALNVKRNENQAKNVILFIGDGMGPNTVTATRIHKGGESYRMAFEEFPSVGILKTYSANKMVPDSASTATALFTGIKVNHRTIGVDATVSVNDCPKSLDPEARLKSLAALALDAGKSAGFVTTMRVTHATPAPLYAHSANRNWECEGTMPAGSRDCKDIARQLVEDWPGIDLHVIMGGGRQVLVSNSTGTEGDPISAWSCYRTDGRNLIEDYTKDKEERGLKFSVVQNNKELSEVNFDDTDYLMGIFANEHMKYEFERDHSPEGMPSISEMVEAAIKVLRRNPKGYFLMVEGGNIDMAHHRGRAKTAITEAAAFEDAVRVAMAMTAEADTLLVVTADHTHTLSINGYPDRGSNIFGHPEVSPHDHKPYTTLSYGTGGPGALHYTVEGGGLVRREPGDSDDFMYEQIAGVILDENSHGGGDVTIYAKGPHSHLIHRVHEQHFVFHALAYAARLGERIMDYSCLQVQNCFGYRRLRVGCIWIGLFKTCVFTAAIVGAHTLLSTKNQSTLDTTVLLVILVVFLLLSAMLAAAAYRRYRFYLLIYWIANPLLATISLVLLTLYPEYVNRSRWIIISIYGVLDFYFQLVVRSYYVELKSAVTH